MDLNRIQSRVVDSPCQHRSDIWNSKCVRFGSVNRYGFQKSRRRWTLSFFYPPSAPFPVHVLVISLRSSGELKLKRALSNIVIRSIFSNDSYFGPIFGSFLGLKDYGPRLPRP